LLHCAGRKKITTNVRHMETTSRSHFVTTQYK